MARPGRVIEKKGEDSAVKEKVTNILYFTDLGRNPTEPICIKFCREFGVIMFAKFQNEIF